MDATPRTALRRLLLLYWLAGAVPMAIVGAVLLASLWRAGLAQPALERSLSALAGLVVLVLVASALFAWLLARKLAGQVEAAADAWGETAPLQGEPPPAASAAGETDRLRRALESENRARQAAEASSRRAEELLTTLAHELRNPLGAIGNAVRVLERLPPGSPDYKAAREIVARQTEHLAKAVHDLLEVGTGSLPLRRNLLDLAHAAGAAVAALKASSAHEWVLQTQSVLVSADPARLDQILAHLLGAAVARTPPGGRIALTLREAAGEALLRIEDGGSAAPPASDIGFRLAQRLVELHGGELQAQAPEDGSGAGFALRLPALPEPEPAAERLARPLPAPRPTRHARVLIVEDNEDSRVTLQRILQAEGHLVSAARDAQAGLQAAMAGSPSVAVVDIGLPGMDGYAFARAMRERLGRGVRLIALTGYGSEADRRRAAEAGFDAHLTKPVDIDRLLAVISENYAS